LCAPQSIAGTARSYIGEDPPALIGCRVARHREDTKRLCDASDE
jgi:hypothetical protein